MRENLLSKGMQCKARQSSVYSNVHVCVSRLIEHVQVRTLADLFRINGIWEDDLKINSSSRSCYNLPSLLIFFNYLSTKSI